MRVTTLRALPADRVRQLVRAEGIVIDLRAPAEYLSAHIPGSIPLLYEAGPGLGGRARDLLPLDARLVILEDPTSPLDKAADAFRGKGYEVVGYFPGGVAAWPDAAGGTPVLALANAQPGMRLVDVADPGTQAPATWTTLVRIPAEELWSRSRELDPEERIGVLAGWGVRACAAVGILEHLGFRALTYVRTRGVGERPAMAPADYFRAGGPA
ncbi:MAG TPA: rhodanese-like domain-containing protein [Actinomycetota bacterium]|nr:rhodanese-like domain-containing protein [Actinomycetota bacterium]